MADKTVEFLRGISAALDKYAEAIEDELNQPIEVPLVEEPVVDEPPVNEPTDEYPVEEPIIDPVVEPVVEPIETPIEDVNTTVLLPIDVVVDEILEGKWGSGDARKQKLEEAGYIYELVQDRVNEILRVVQEVLDGKWETGDARKQRLTEAGYSYDTVQRQINRQLSTDKHDEVVNSMNAWAKKIAADNRYHYNKWNSKVPQSKKCPICSGLKYENDKAHFGWNCIGFGAAVLHHGGGLPTTCNCHVIGQDSKGHLDIYDAKTDATALALAQKKFGIKQLQVIRNKKGIPKSQWMPGDYCCHIDSTGKFIHVFYYLGNGLIADSTGSNGKVANDNQIAVRKYDKYSARCIIRWTGGFEHRSIESLARDVLAGRWGSGDTRKMNLLAAGLNYDAIQAKVNQLAS